MHVLVVDDNELNREIATTLLEQKEIKVDQASSGKQAISMIESSSLSYYKVVLMDIQMPNMNGFETTQAIRQLKRIDAKNIPIIALSANTQTLDRDKALTEGMGAFLTKPFRVEDFIQALYSIDNN